MKIAIAFLAALILNGSAEVLRKNPLRTQNQVEQQWNSQFPEILQPKIQERTFKDGNEYRYLYEGQILTGIPEVNNQYSGAKIRALVRIQLGAKDLMQIEKVFVGSLHERFVADPGSHIPLDVFEQLPEQDAPFEEVLKKPVQFTFENGKIRDFEVVEDDPSWSINIKRAILSTFHLSLTDRELVEDEITRRDPQRNELRGTQRRQGSQGQQTNENEEYFTVIEDGIGGRCESTYVILQTPDQKESVFPIYDTESYQGGRPRVPPTTTTGNQNVLNVTKTYNHRNCEYRPFVYKGMHFTHPCPHCETDPDSFFEFLESAAHTRYNITGNKQEYIIDSAITEAVYKVTPRSHIAGSLLAYAFVNTTLIFSGPVAQPIQFLPQNSVQIDGLHMVDAKFSRKQGEIYIYETPEASRPITQKPQYWPFVGNKPQRIRVLFEKLVQGMQQKEVSTQITTLVEDIVRLMIYADDQELDQIYNQIKTVSGQGVEREEIDHLFADLLVSTGTKCTFTYLKRLITEQKIKGSVLTDVFALVAHKMDVQQIDQPLIEKMLELCQSQPVQNDVLAKRSCWMSFGTLVHKACAHVNFDARVAWKDIEGKYNGGQPKVGGRQSQLVGTEEPENLRCPVEFRTRIAQQIADKIKTSDEEEKITALKTLGNMGLKETVDELETIIEDDSVPVYIRTTAIYALRHIAPVQPEMVQRILVPLYRQTNNPTQVRIVSFIVLMAAQPKLPVLEHIVQSLNEEPDVDVSSYVYSSLISLANSTDPCLKNVTRDIQLALEFTEPINFDMRHSTAFHKGVYHPTMKSGLFWEVDTIMDKDSPLPRAGRFRLHANVMKKSLEIFEMYFETEGLGDLVRQYANLTAESLSDIISGKAPRRSPRNANVPVPEDINEIDRLLNIEPKQPKAIRGTAAVALFGQETRFVVINPETLGRFIAELMGQSREIIPKLLGEGLPIDNRRALLLLNTRVEFPSVLGVPISTSLRLPIIGGIKGNLKVNVTPRPQPGPSILMDLAKAKTVTLEASNVQTQIAGELHAKMSVYLAFLKVGTGIRTRLSMNIPIDGKLDLSLLDKMTKLSINMPENPFKLVKLESYPVTYITLMSRNEKTYQPKTVPPRPQITLTGEQLHEELPMHTRQQQEEGQQLLKLKIQPVETKFVTDNGHVRFSKLTGIPVPVADLWEIPSPDFHKSRMVNLTIGQEQTGFVVKVGYLREYPDSRLPTTLVPSLLAKQTLDVDVVPKKGLKKFVITLFTRDELTHMPERELLNKLQDKLSGIQIKEITKANTPKDYDKLLKHAMSLQVLINSEGTEAPEAWTTRGLLALLYTFDGRYVKTVGALESKVLTPLRKVCFAGELRYPDRNNMWFLTPQEPLSNKSINGNLELSWGQECGSNDNMLKVRLRMQKSKEQRLIERQDVYNIDGVPVSTLVAHEITEAENLFESLWKQCKQDRQRGAFFTKECVDFAIKYTELLRLKVDIEYKNIPKPVRKVLNRVEDLTRGLLIWNTDVEDVDVKNTDNKINAIVELSTDRNMLDIKYQTPTKNVNITNVVLPVDIVPASAMFPWNPARLVGRNQMPVCTLTGPKIFTFDDISDEQPLSGNCWHVLVKDNRPDNVFAVLVANVAPNSVAKKVAVLFKGHRIEVVPRGGQVPAGDPSQPIDVASQYVVRYNGQELPEALSPEKRTTIPPNFPQEKQEIADIILAKPEMTGSKQPIVSILSTPTGIVVLFDGSSVTVLPSIFWKGGVVGLCGTFNGQPWDDLLLPNNTVVDTAEDYARAFMIKKDGCDATIPEFKARTRKFDRV